MRLVARNFRWLVLFPSVLAGTVIFLTRDIKREYQSSTTVYTGLASGYSITDDGNQRIDYFSVNNAFDNLIATVKSRETIEEVALKLLAEHLILEAPDPNILDKAGFEQLQELVPMEERAKIVVKGNAGATYEKLQRIKDSTNRNIVVFILTTPGSYYTITEIIGKITVMRKSSSDMLEVTYTTTDAGVCQHTLQYLSQAFSRRYRGIKGSETSNVVKYFEDQLKLAFGTLQGSENKLKDFGIQNRIINYYEQAKFVAESKEDLSTDYYKERMQYEAANTAMKRLEEKMSTYMDVVNNNEEMVKLRQELSDITFKINNAKIYKVPSSKIIDMEEQADNIKLRLKEKGRDFFNLNNSIEWVPQHDLLTEWLDKMVNLEESKGKLQVYESRMKQYDGIYMQFAPLGSTLGRLEREVSISEKQYLSVLHGLNLAKLRQQNLEMSNSLKVVDEPFYPLQALPSKRSLLIIVAFAGGFIILLSFFIAQELLDKSVKTPEHVAKETGLPLLNALPNVTNKNDSRLEEVQHALMQRIINSIFIELKRNGGVKPHYLISVISTKPSQGKTYFAEGLVRRLVNIRKNVHYLYPETSKGHSGDELYKQEKLIAQQYPVIDKVIDVNNLEELIRINANEDPVDVSYSVVELPALNKYPVPFEIIEKSDFSILIVHAAKSWTSSDKQIITEYEKIKPNGVKVLLNFVEIDNLEGIYGDIPKNRSWIRKKLKIALGGDKY